MDTEKIKRIARSDLSKVLVEYLKDVQGYIADIRNGTYTNETRIAAVDVIQKLLIDKLHTLSGNISQNKDDYK